MLDNFLGERLSIPWFFMGEGTEGWTDDFAFLGGGLKIVSSNNTEPLEREVEFSYFGHFSNP